MVQEFVPKSGVYIETDPDAQQGSESRVGATIDDREESEKLWQKLMELKKELPDGFELRPIEFEKDDDTNYHMDAIAGLANLRARNYRYLFERNG